MNNENKRAIEIISNQEINRLKELLSQIEQGIIPRVHIERQLNESIKMINEIIEINNQ